MNKFKIEAELKASIRELSGGEVRFWFRTNPDWRFEDIKENGGICLIGQIEYETDVVKDEIEERRYFMPIDRVSRAYGRTVLKGILVEMVYDHLRSLSRLGGPVEERMDHMPYAPETSGFFNRSTFDRILLGPWFEEQVHVTGSVETVLEDGTALSVRFDDTGICTVCRNGEPENQIHLICGSRLERKKGKRPMEEQMEFTYPVCGDVVGRVITGQGVTGPFRKSWYTESHLLSGSHDSWLRVDPDLRKQWDLAKTLDVIRGVDSLTDILEAIRLYDKYHDKEGRGGLMTEKIEKALLAVDEEELAGTPKAGWKVIVMYFDPRNLSNQWLIVSGRKRSGGFELYGLVHLLEWEWGSVSLRQLEEAAHRPGDPPGCCRILREVSVCGQRLEDVLKSHPGRPGWEELL